MSSLVVRVPPERLQAHASRMRRQCAMATLVAGVVFAGSIAVQLAGLELGLVWLCAVVVAQLAGGASLVAGAWLWVRLGRAAREGDELEVAIDDDCVTARRGNAVVHEDATLAHVTAFPDWVRLTIDADRRVSFAVPVDDADRARLLDVVPPDRRGEQRSFLGWWALAVLAISSFHAVFQVITVAVAIALAAAVLAVPVLLWRVAGPHAGMAAFVLVATVAAIASALRFARWAPTAPGRAALRGVLVAIALAVAHAAGWGIYLAAGSTPRDYRDASSFGLSTFIALSVLGALPGIPWGVLCGMLPIARPRWPRPAFVAVALAPPLVIGAAVAFSDPRSAIALVPAIGLAALGGLMLAPRHRA